MFFYNFYVPQQFIYCQAQYNALSDEEKEIMDVLLQDDNELPSNLEEDEILDIAKLRFQVFCQQSGRFDTTKNDGRSLFKVVFVGFRYNIQILMTPINFQYLIF